MFVVVYLAHFPTEQHKFFHYTVDLTQPHAMLHCDPDLHFQFSSDIVTPRFLGIGITASLLAPIMLSVPKHYDF